MAERSACAARGASKYVLVAAPAALAFLAVLLAITVTRTALAQPLAVPAADAEPRLDLERAILLALERNERALAAGERVRAAEARVARARAFFFPDLSATGTYTRRAHETRRDVGGGQEVTIQSRNALRATLSVGLAIFDARSIPLYRQARIEHEAVRLEARNEALAVAFETASAYLVTLGQEQVVAAAGRRVEFARQTADDARGRVAAQLASSNDLTRAELERTAAELELTRARAELETAYLELGFLIDAEVPGPLVVPDALLAQALAPPPRAEALVASARTVRVDLAGRRKRAEAQEAYAAEASARALPSLDLFGQFSVTSEAGLSNGDTDWLVGLTLTWLIWDGGERSAERRERLAGAAIADHEVRAAERQADVDVRAALVALGRAQTAVRESEAVVAAAQKNAQESAVLYREGLVRAIEVADASARLFDAEVALARERYGLALVLLQLRSASGLDPLGRELSK